MGSVDSFKAKGTLEVDGQSYEIYRLAGVKGQETLPYSLKVLLENLLRTEDGANITADHVHARPRDHAGLHRCALCRRPRHDA